MSAPITNIFGDGWRAVRWDCDDGDIQYHAYGPQESFVIFEGVNSKKDCEAFMQAVGGKIDD